MVHGCRLDSCPVTGDIATGYRSFQCMLHGYMYTVVPDGVGVSCGVGLPSSGAAFQEGEEPIPMLIPRPIHRVVCHAWFVEQLWPLVLVVDLVTAAPPQPRRLCCPSVTNCPALISSPSGSKKRVLTPGVAPTRLIVPASCLFPSCVAGTNEDLT